MQQPSIENDYQAAHIALLCHSYEKLLGKPLLPAGLRSISLDVTLGRAAFEATFALLSHGTQDDPVFNYANKMAMDLFEMDWQAFTALPSRYSAEPVNRETRQALLDEVTSKGYIAHYEGVRISSSGQRFLIRDAVVWNLYNEAGEYAGQAAAFDQWEMV